MVLILNDGSKLKCRTPFREKQKVIEENIIKKSQIQNLNS